MYRFLGKKEPLKIYKTQSKSFKKYQQSHHIFQNYF